MQPVVVHIALDMIQLHRACAIGQDPFVSDALDGSLFARLGQLVRLHRAWGRQALLEKRFADVMRDNGGALGHERAQAASVVKVVMRVDHVFDRLVRDDLLHLGDHRHGAFVVLRPFDDHQMILHFYQHAVMRPACQVPDAIRHLLGLHLHGRLADIVRHLDVGRRMGFDLADGQIEGREASLFLRDLGGKLHPAKILVLGVGRLRQHIAKDGIGVPGFHLLDQVALVDLRVDLQLAGHHKGDGGQLLATFRARLHGGLVCQGRFDHAVRGNPELMLAVIDGRQGRGDGILPDLVPGMGATHSPGAGAVRPL